MKDERERELLATIAAMWDALENIGRHVGHSPAEMSPGIARITKEALSNFPASVSRFLDKMKALEGVVEAARNAVGIHTDIDGKQSARFQPECDGYAQDLLDALAALDGGKE